nr:hypothetical protein CFP56_14786 [Quercus suber]
MSSFQLPHDTKAANLVVLPTCLGCQYGGLWILQLSVGMHEFNLFLASAGAKPCNHYKRFICFKCTTINAGNLSAAPSLDFVGNELISVCDHIASVVCCGLLYL